MSDHLSATQFAKAFVEGPAGLEQQHLAECAQCRAELNRLGGAVSSFRLALRERVDGQVESQGTAISIQPARPVARPAKFGWVLGVAAIVTLMLMPLFPRVRESREVIDEANVQTDPDVLMDAVSIHLLRTIPAPMEPMLALVPSAESKTESGGDR